MKKSCTDATQNKPMITGATPIGRRYQNSIFITK